MDMGLSAIKVAAVWVQLGLVQVSVNRSSQKAITDPLSDAQGNKSGGCTINLVINRGGGPFFKLRFFREGVGG